MTKVSACCVAFLGAVMLLPVGAQASNSYTATLVKPVSSVQNVVVGLTAWRCEDSTCKTTSSTQTAGTIPACHELVGQVGAVSAYGSAERPFDADSLIKCNGQ
jgi:hypothetical protein